MVAFVKVIQYFLLILVILINGLLSDAYSQIGVNNMATGGCINTASNERVRRDPMVEDWSTEWTKFKLRGPKLAVDGNMRFEKVRGNGPYEGTFKTLRGATLEEQGEVSAIAIDTVKDQPRIKRSLISKQREVAGYRDFTNDYDLGPMHHPPKNN